MYPLRHKVPYINAKPSRPRKASHYRITSRRISLYHYRINRPRSLSTSLQQSLSFEQLTRPSRKVLYYDLCRQGEESNIGKDVLLFLVRPIQLDPSQGFASAYQVQREHIEYALDHRGISVANIDRIPGSVCEFRVLIRACDAGYIPSDADPLLALDPYTSKKDCGRAIPPLLFEQVDPQITAPSRLFFRDDSETDDYLPHYSLIRNSDHPKDSNKVITAVLDNNLNVLPLLGPFTPKTQPSFAIPNLGRFRGRNASDEGNIELGLSPHIANAIVDWEQVFKRSGQNILDV